MLLHHLIYAIATIAVCHSIQVSGSRIEPRNEVLVAITWTPSSTIGPPPTAAPTSGPPAQIYEHVDKLEFYPQNHESEASSADGQTQLDKFADFQFVLKSLSKSTPAADKQMCTTRYHHAIPAAALSPDSKQDSRASALCFWKYSVDLWNRRQKDDSPRDVSLPCDEVMGLAWRSIQAVKNGTSVLRTDLASDQQILLTSSYWSEDAKWGVDITYWDDGCLNKTAPVDRSAMKGGK
ncbi:hypothetical protein TWF696_005831 [Orbilia brochopaga]|uniref:Uncharacterized protein n=1 Tax=Orbilia brochopaga TaxID=3140254 RepID=A0AAV9UVQ4_9PEZI